MLVTRMAPFGCLQIPQDTGGMAGCVGAAHGACLSAVRRDSGYVSPMREGNNTLGYWPTADAAGGGRSGQSLWQRASAGVFQGDGYSIAWQGRFFSEQDRMGGEPIVVIDEALAQQAFGGGQNAKSESVCIFAHGLRPLCGSGRSWPCAPLGTRWRRSGGDSRSFTILFAQLPMPVLRRWLELMNQPWRRRSRH